MRAAPIGQYKAGGGKIAALFDGTEKVVSWDSFPWYIRTVSALQVHPSDPASVARRRFASEAH
jgi:hypothetical protein